MTGAWDEIQAQLRNGRLGRREFLGAAAALGISTTLAHDAVAQTPRRGGHLILGLRAAGTGDKLDPAFFHTDYLNVFGQELFDGLTVTNAVNGQVVLQPALAESWSVDDKVMRWVFKLRRGVTFHNGKELTAADVIYSINHHRGPDTKSTGRALVTTITGIRAVDKYEVEFLLDSGNVDFPYILGDWHFVIVPEGTNWDAPDGIGTGAFKLESFEPGVRGLVKRNANDYRTDRGYVDSVETLAINDPAARLNALMSGAVHLISNVEPSIAGRVAKNPLTQIFSVESGGNNSFGMFVDTPPYDNPDIRLALKYALDREAMLKTIFHGYGVVGNDTPIPSFDPWVAADLPQRPYDLDKARYHFKKANATAPIVMTAADGAFAGAVDMAQLFQASARKAGIPVEVNRVPNDGYFSAVWTKNPFCAAPWGPRPTIDITMSSTFQSDSGLNDTRWKRPDFDKMLAAARGETNETKRKQIYHDLQVIIYEEGGKLIPTFNNIIDGGSRKIRGFVPTPTRQLSSQRAPEKVWFES